MKRLVSLAAALALIGAGLSAQAAKPQAAPTITKDETVWATLEPSGAVKGIWVSDWIHSDKPGVEIKDKSNLTSIENVKGYEQPRRVGDALMWKLDGSDLYYRGKTTKALPLQVTIKYWLDGKPIDPQALSGKSGTVRVRLEVKNLASSDRMIDGAKKRIYAPIIAGAIMVLPVTSYKDLGVAGAYTLTDGQSSYVASLLLPGLKDSILAASGGAVSAGSGGSIDVSSMGLKDLSIPESFEFTITTDNFKLGPIYLVAMPYFPDLGGSDSTKLLDDAMGSFQQISEGVKALADGTEALSKGGGTESFGAIGEAIGGVRPFVESNKQTIDAISAFLASDDNIQSLRNVLDSTKGLKESLPEIYDFIDRFYDPRNQAALARLSADTKKIDVKNILNIPGASSILSDESLTAMAEALVANDDLYRGMDERRLQAAASFAMQSGPVFNALVNFDDTAKAYDASAGLVLQNFGAKSADYGAAAGRLASLGDFNAAGTAASLGARAEADASYLAATDFLESPDAAALKAKLASGEALTDAERYLLTKLFSAAEDERAAAKGGATSVKAASIALPILADSARLASEARYASAAAAGMSAKVLPGLAQAKADRNKTEQGIAGGRVMLDPKTVATVTTTVSKISVARKTFDKNRYFLKTARTYLSMRMQDSGFRAQVAAIDALQKDLKDLEPLILQSQEALSSPQISSLFSPGQSSMTTAKVKNLVKDLSEFQPILSAASDALKPENVKKARQVLADLPQMMNTLDQLGEGAKVIDKLATSFIGKGGNGTASGTMQFDTQSIQKLSTDILDKAKILRGFLKVKDELSAISKDYKTFSGAPDGAQTQLKFIFKTDEIR
jgi:putative membrane protein